MSSKLPSGPALSRSLRIGTLRLPSGSYNLCASEAHHQQLQSDREGSRASHSHSNGFSNRVRSSCGLGGRPSSKSQSGTNCQSNSVQDEKNRIKCVVLMLDDSKQSFEVHKKAKGSALVEMVFEQLGFPQVERDYFGLQFAERTEDVDGMRWLDPSKAIKKQFKLHPPYLFYFRVKFYVGDPCRLTEEHTRYHFFLQIKKDILEGRLVIPQPTAILLASYAVQSDLGDYNPDEHLHGYLADMRLVPNQTEDLEAKISELHKMHRGQYPSEAEYNFLQHAKRLDMYGVDLHRARDSKHADIQLGVTSQGLVVFQNNIKMNTFSWAKIIKISFKKKQFFIQLRREGGEEYDNLLGFNMSSYRSCKILWQSCVEHHAFFRLQSTSYYQNSKGLKKLSLFSIGSKFRYSGRSAFETMLDAETVQREKQLDTLPANSAMDDHPSSLPGSWRETPGGKQAPNWQGPSPSSRVQMPTTPQQQQGSTPAELHLHPRQQSSTAAGSPCGGANADPSTPRRSQQQTQPPQQQQQLPVKGRGAYLSITGVHVQAPHCAGAAGASPRLLSRGAVRPSQVADDSRLTLTPRMAWSSRVASHPHQPSTTHDQQIHHNQKCQNNLCTCEEGEGLLESIMRTPGFCLRLGEASMLRYADDDEDESPSCTSANITKLQAFGDGVQKVGTTGGDKAPDKSDSLNNNSEKSVNKQQLQHQQLYFANSEQLQQPLNNSSTTSASHVSSPSSDSVGSASLVRVRLKADEQGRYGFNVKGGCDQNNSPIVVSRVGPNTPADTATPRLREGDEVVAINGNDVRGLSHDQVVKLIRSWVVDDKVNSPTNSNVLSGGGQSGSQDKDKDGTQERRRRRERRQSHLQELVLTVRPQAFLLRPGEEVDSEPDFQYIPLSASDLDSPRVTSSVNVQLQESMLLLKEGLHSGAVVAQFEQLYRKKPGMASEVSKLAKNAHKNRYKDISPYDSTRVILSSDGGNGNDYINASYVIMKVPSSGIVNRYIATQGPLDNTCVDLWQMVWEQQSTLVVMLTTLVEKGRLKCYKYWPNLYETHNYGKLQVSCVSEKETSSFAFREFSLINSLNNEERHISHMQYLAWPDHGVPDDATDFLDFIHRVRSNRDAMVEPTMVHCSAGIGRTGVLILMETAMCLIEANEPVYPLDITRVMRDQRAMLIQTASQYKFVCEAILKVYKEGIVKPLPEYQR